MRILLLGDLHGKLPRIDFKGFELVLSTGDFCPVSSREYKFKVIQEKLKDPSYSRNWYDLVGKEKAIEMIRADLEKGREALEKLDSLGIPVLTVPGNTDHFRRQSGLRFEAEDHYRELLSGLKNVKDCHLRLESFGGFQVIGHGTPDGSPEYPQYDEDLERFTPEQLEKKRKEYKKTLSDLDALFREASGPVIFLSHNVPFGTCLDLIEMKSSPRHGWHYGSVAASEMIKKHQPPVFIGGHMHECTGTDRMGKTLCINVGTGTVLLELSGKGVKSLDFKPDPYYKF